MYKYKLANPKQLDEVLISLQDYLLEKERWLVVKDYADVDTANKCSILKEQISLIQRRLHSQDETLNHYLDNYHQLNAEQVVFLLCGFNPHCLEGDCLQRFKLCDDNSLLSNYLTQKTPAGRKVIKGFNIDSEIPIEKLIRWSSAKGFIFNRHNRVLSKELTTNLHSLLVESNLVEDGEIQQLWSWLKSDVLLAYLIVNLTSAEIITPHHRWRVMESYISQKGVQRLSKIEIHKDIRLNDHQLVDRIIINLNQLGF